MKTSRRKLHLIKSLNHGDTGFYPTYCGWFFNLEHCTRKIEEASCKTCQKAYRTNHKMEELPHG